MEWVGTVAVEDFEIAVVGERGRDITPWFKNVVRTIPTDIIQSKKYP
jgi:hypothetical protein